MKNNSPICSNCVAVYCCPILVNPEMCGAEIPRVKRKARDLPPEPLDYDDPDQFDAYEIELRKHFHLS